MVQLANKGLSLYDAEMRSLLQLLTAVVLVLLGFGASRARAGEIRMRAREHYELLRVENSSGTASYRGFTNTIDLWYEEPYSYSIGLAGSPLFATLQSKAPLADYGNRIRLLHLGAEATGFPWGREFALFFRLGAFDATLDSRGEAGRMPGWSLLEGLGYEFDLGGIGLAPEIAWRQGKVARSTKFSGVAPALGLHFYKML